MRSAAMCVLVPAEDLSPIVLAFGAKYSTNNTILVDWQREHDAVARMVIVKSYTMMMIGDNNKLSNDNKNYNNVTTIDR